MGVRRRSSVRRGGMPSSSSAAEIERDVAHLAVARRTRPLLDAVEDALMEMHGLGELSLLHVALDAQIIDALSDVRLVLHPEPSPYDLAATAQLQWKRGRQAENPCILRTPCRGTI